MTERRSTKLSSAKPMLYQFENKDLSLKVLADILILHLQNTRQQKNTKC